MQKYCRKEEKLFLAGGLPLGGRAPDLGPHRERIYYEQSTAGNSKCRSGPSLSREGGRKKRKKKKSGASNLLASFEPGVNIITDAGAWCHAMVKKKRHRLYHGSAGEEVQGDGREPTVELFMRHKHQKTGVSPHPEGILEGRSTSL